MENHSFIAGLGWVDNSTITCRECGDDGRIITAWADDGDTENGPAPYATDFRYCECEKGVEAKQVDDEDYRRDEEFEASLVAAWEARTKVANL